MPLFDYTCSACGNKAVDHMVQSYKNDTTLPCKCGWEMTRDISRTSFALKGSGWAAGGYVKEVVHHMDGIKTTAEGDTRILN